MTQLNAIKNVHNTSYYTGSHPEIRSRYTSGKRPTDFGNKVWPTSLILIDYLHTKPFPLDGLRVLEIGCGFGIIGIYLAKEHSCQVTCTDFDEHVLPIVQLQSQLNDVSVSTKQASFGDLSESFLQNFDFIIGSEVCYSDQTKNDLLELKNKAYSSNVSKMIIADPGRPDFNEFHESAHGRYKNEMVILPGSTNGKRTRVSIQTKSWH